MHCTLHCSAVEEEERVMRASCDKRWKFSAAHFQISDLTGALVRGDTEHNETKRQHFRNLS